MSNELLTKKLEEFVLTRSYFDLEKILAEANPEINYGLNIRLVELFDWDPDLGEECLMRPMKFLESFEEAIQRAQPRILLVHEFPNRLRVKPKILARFTALPLTPWTFFERIPTASSLGRLLSVRGTVIRTGSLKMQEFSKEWECTRCKTKQVTFIDDHQYGNILKPVTCSGIVDEVACKNVKFNEVISDEPVVHVDYQEIKIQELTSVLEIGAVPRSILVLLRHELVDQCRAGDDVIITGILGCRFKPNLKVEASRLDGELFLQATSIQSTALRELTTQDESEIFDSFVKYWNEHCENELRGRSEIVNAFCPQLHGMFFLKLATLMTIIGGSDTTSCETNNESGPRKSRKEGHLLLVGDPGTGKSQFLVNAARMVNRSVMTTGSGSTMAGLTCAAVKDGPDWQLEAGALVMADRGICCIDEFNALRPQDRTAIHEAMEQQTLSVAKAGLVCKLNTRCSIIAACNAKGEIEDGKTISGSLALASPLLSRFDLIFLLLDRKRREDSWDAELCDRLLFQNRKIVNKPLFWDFEKLKQYLKLVRNRFNPTLSRISEIVLSKYYQLQRRMDTLRCARTTVRLLESLVRLAQSHAKLMFHEEVTLQDAMTAIILVEMSLTSTQTIQMAADLQAPEPSDFSTWYEAIEKEMLFKLEINKSNILKQDNDHEDEHEKDNENILKDDGTVSLDNLTENDDWNNLLNMAGSSVNVSFAASFTQL